MHKYQFSIICLSICLSVHEKVGLSMHPSIHPFTHPCVCLSVWCERLLKQVTHIPWTILGFATLAQRTWPVLGSNPQPSVRKCDVLPIHFCFGAGWFYNKHARTICFCFILISKSIARQSRPTSVGEVAMLCTIFI